MKRVHFLMLMLLFASSENTYSQNKFVVKLIDSDSHEQIGFAKIMLTSKQLKLRSYDKQNKTYKFPAAAVVDSVLSDFSGLATIKLPASYSKKKLYLNFSNSLYIDKSVAVDLSQPMKDTLVVELKLWGNTLGAIENRERNIHISSSKKNATLLIKDTTVVFSATQKFEISGRNNSPTTLFVNAVRSAASDCVVSNYPKILKPGESFKIDVEVSNSAIQKDAVRIISVSTSDNHRTPRIDSFSIICKWIN